MKKKAMVLLLIMLGVGMTGCGSIAQNAKPPLPYPSNSVFDGNSMDLGDPDSIVKAYEKHIQSLENDPYYRGNPTLSGGADMLAVPTEWSKSFFSFEIIDYDIKNQILVFALQTTLLAKGESNEETDTYYSDSGENQPLISAVGVYDVVNKESRYFYREGENGMAGSGRDAGTGKYSFLVKKLETGKMAICFDDEIQFYTYSEENRNFEPAEQSNYSLEGFFTSDSFIESAKGQKLLDDSVKKETRTQLENRYSIKETTEGMIAPASDTEAIHLLMTKVGDLKDDYADILFKADTPGETSQNGIWNTLDQVKTGLERTPFSRGTYEVRFNNGEIENETREYTVPNQEEGYVPWYIDIETSAGTYTVESKLYKKQVAVYSKSAWKGKIFTIHDIAYEKKENGEYLPLYLQVELSPEEERGTAAREKAKDENLVDYIGTLEDQALSKLNDGTTKWLKVHTIVETVDKVVYRQVSDIQVIKGKDQLDQLFQQEKKRIEKAIENNEDKFKQIHEDSTIDISDRNIKELEQQIETAAEQMEENGEEDGEGGGEENGGGKENVVRIAGMGARFYRKDSMSQASAESIYESGQRLLDLYREIYRCQEQIKQISVYLDCCQGIMENPYYPAAAKCLAEYYQGISGAEVSKEQVYAGDLNNTWLETSLLPDDWKDGAAENPWEAVRKTVVENPEKSKVTDYVCVNYENLQNGIHARIKAMEGLGDAAVILSQTQESGGQVSLYDQGFSPMLQSLYNLSQALEQLYQGQTGIEGYRKAMTDLETDEICIKRFDDEISEEQKTFLEEQCDTMQGLLETILAGGDNDSRALAMKTLQETKWQIDISPSIADGMICMERTQQQATPVSTVIWKAVIEETVDERNEYIFNVDRESYICFDGREDRVRLGSFSSMLLRWNIAVPTEKALCYSYQLIERQKQEDLMGMDQVVQQQIQTGQGKYRILLLSETGTDGGTPRWLMSAMDSDFAEVMTAGGQNYSKHIKGEVWYPSEKRYSFEYTFKKFGHGFDQIHTGTYSCGNITKETKNYQAVYGRGGKENSMSGLSEEEIRKRQEAANNSTVAYQEQIRGLLGQDNTIFMDNPNLKDEQFYFIGISLDNGAWLYRIDAAQDGKGDIKPVRQIAPGSYFKAWWAPREVKKNEKYNDEGRLMGGTLYLLGLTEEDAGTYSVNEGDSTSYKRELVPDDIYHSRLYHITLSDEEMNKLK